MTITIIGWYGTETIGDRAILAGLFSILHKSFGKYRVQLGSLNPIYTQRTLLEDIDFYKKCSSNTELQISTFDTQSPSDIRCALRKSDLLIVGGGPLMDLIEMRMLDYAFKYAHSHHIKTALLGCGWGPLKTDEAINITQRLVETADLTIFRDSISQEQCRNYVSDKTTYSIIDPAFIACRHFLDIHKKILKDDYIAVNFRDVSVEADHYAQGDFTAILTNLIAQIYDTFHLPIKFVPMHNFPIGGDDRILLDEIKHQSQNNDVEVVWDTQSLFQTMELYANATICFGMRFHSVVLQTVLNGDNYIIDYTDPQKGKIIGMLKQIDAMLFYKDRYISLFASNPSFDFTKKKSDKFHLNNEMLTEYETLYVELISKYLI